MTGPMRRTYIGPAWRRAPQGPSPEATAAAAALMAHARAEQLAAQRPSLRRSARSAVWRSRRMLAPLVGIAVVLGAGVLSQGLRRAAVVDWSTPAWLAATVIAAVVVLTWRRPHRAERVAGAVVAVVYLVAVACGV